MQRDIFGAQGDTWPNIGTAAAENMPSLVDWRKWESVKKMKCPN